MNQPACEGIFYVVRLPDGWRLIPRRFDRGEDVGHTEWWEESLAEVVAGNWAQVLGVSAQALASTLALSPYGFPRGRVAKVGRTFLIYHGSDLVPAMEVPRKIIEEAFGIAGQCRWSFDEHERCLLSDQDVVRQCLELKDEWSAV